jgi:uroporphyrinogen III methyltransferase / synthase
VSGFVYLVGAGPGDPGLLTLRGRECIAEADVVIHDYLVDRRLLRHARPQAEVVSSGKSGDASHRDRQQQEINERMIAAARAGRVVVRLKGGDPFVFGRGGEEARALADAGIRFEIVPGVSSAIAVPAYAGIPVTERGLNSSFTVVTGHEAPGTAHPLDWWALARMDTLVFLMGLRATREIVARLQGAGMPPNTPAACICSGTRPAQQTVVGTLGDIADEVVRSGFEPPAVLVVGEVVKRRAELTWFERRPLLGRRIVVTRAAAQAVGFVERLERLGAEAIAAPTIELAGAASPAALDSALASLESFDWIVFTSAHGVAVFFSRLHAVGGDARRLGRARLAVIGMATAQALAAHGLFADLVPEAFRGEALGDALAPQVSGRRVLLPRAEGAREVLANILASAGANVVDVPTYRVRPVTELCGRVRGLLGAGAIDAITFTSPSTVRGFHALLDGGARATGDARIACIGPVTAEAARALGWNVDVEAREYTTEGLTKGLIDYFAGRG